MTDRLLGGFGEIPARLTVGQLRKGLASYPDDLLVAAVYDNGLAGGRIVGIRKGPDPDENRLAVLLVVD